MKYNRNFSHGVFMPARFLDGSVKTLPVDDFPVSAEGVYNDAGWPMSDVGILDRFSREHRDRSEIERIAARLEVIQDNSSSNDGKTDEQLLREIRPAWVQTASEFADFQAMLLSSMSTTAESGSSSVELGLSSAESGSSSVESGSSSAESVGS